MQEVEKKEESVQDNQTPKIEPDGEYELFVLDRLKPEQTVRIGRALPVNIWMELAELLIKYKDIFAWSSKDLRVVHREFTEHKLVLEESKLFFQ